ncbi:unnamed protein product, partial [Meganyctiphanes norvegica]
LYIVSFVQLLKMIAIAALLPLQCIAFAIGAETHANITTAAHGQPLNSKDHFKQGKILVGMNSTTSDRPRDCQDIIKQGKTYKGHYVVYLNVSMSQRASMIFCSVDDGMIDLPSDMDNKEPARNCWDLLQDGVTTSRTNIIYPFLEHPADPVLVFCDQENFGGGWTVIQNRFDGSEDFYRPWIEYSEGFGNVEEEHYLGNDIIAAITEQNVNGLWIYLEDWDNETAYAYYQAFHLDARFNYQLQVFSYSGSAGDSLGLENVGQNFSTFDADHDDYDADNCAEIDHGAWWYWHCSFSNLNGRYFPSADTDINDGAMYWHSFRGYESLKKSRMAIIPSSGATTYHTRGLHDIYKDVGYKKYLNLT